MELAQRSLQGGMLVLVILAARVLWLDRLPKRTFPILWGVALVRLLAPFSFSSAVSLYTFLQRAQRAADAGSSGISGNVTVKGDLSVWNTVQELTLGQSTPLTDLADQGNQVQILPVIWGVGALLCGAFFAVSYFRCLKSFRRSVPLEDREVRQWLSRHRAGRFVSVRQSDEISAPLTYGIFRPVILLPDKSLQSSGPELEYILQHEYVHICHCDGAVKLAMVAALCVHWFNPLVWVMARLLNRDIELACDEGVLRRFGEQARAGYAMALIGLEEKKRGLMPLYSGFSKNAIEERINLIMKYRKIKHVAVMAASALVAVTVLVFATSATSATAGAATQKGGLPVAAGSAQGTEWGEADLENMLMDPPKGSAGALEPTAGMGTYPGGTDMSGGQYGDGSGAGGAYPGGTDMSGGQYGDGSGAGGAYPGGTDMNGGQYGGGSGAGGTGAAGPGDGAGDGQAQPEYMLRYMQEGMLQEEPANLYVGQGYCLLLPVEGWRATAPDAWMWEYNEQVQFWVSDYTGNTLEQSIDRLKEDGYSEAGEGLLSKEKDGRVFFALMRQSGYAVMCMNYAYPTDSEHMEGFGRILPAIAAGFSILPRESQSGLSEDAGRLEQLALAFWSAYLAGNREAMGQYLTKDCRDSDVFPDGVDGHVAQEASVSAVKGLDIEDKTVGESCAIWVEFRPAAGADYLEYLTLEVVKEAEGWKIGSYMLEL